MIKKIKAFTLSEVLIALGTIGVIAALVLPQLVTKEKATTAKAQFSTAYSMLSKTMADLEIDNKTISIKDFTNEEAGLEPVFNKLKAYNRVTLDCGMGTPSSGSKICMKKYDYKTLANTTYTEGFAGSFVLNNGMAIAINEGQPLVSGTTIKFPIIFVDINGNEKKPNRLGYDLFAFQITPQGSITPVGNPDSFTSTLDNTDPTSYCCNQLINPDCTKASENLDGIGCALYASSDEEYFDKIYKGY
ncbi:MAG: hypothetical protein E7Z87_07545 [Cyanobacteria bacterium SIG26]|nr:hypothetical protein [Cyanobacteria bacterium SIG26]